jgi:CRISPR/Cas system-associated endoribonuclease Cas2
MTIYLISYDLNKQKNYQKLWDALKGNNAHRMLESVWLINLSNTCKEVYDWLVGLTDSDDHLVVTPINKSYFQYRAKAGTNAWLEANS